MNDMRWHARRTLPTNIIMVTTLALAICGGLAGELPRFVITAPVPSGPWQGIICWTIAALAISTKLVRSATAVIALAAIWTLAACADGLATIMIERDLTSFVAPVECLLIGLTLLASAPNDVGRWKVVALSQTVAAVLALLLFGIVHIVRRQDIAALVPHWMPARETVPFLSGFWLIATGLLLLPKGSRRIAACLAALLFASWLPLVHLPRLVDDVRSPFEWQFAFVAVALATSFASLAIVSAEVDLIPRASTSS